MFWILPPLKQKQPDREKGGKVRPTIAVHGPKKHRLRLKYAEETSSNAKVTSR